MKTDTITIAKEFSRYPAGRYESDGPYSGEKFRKNFLLNALRQKQKIKLVFDGARGYGSSFLEEAFGGLVREGFSKSEIIETFEFISEEEPDLRDEIIEYIDDAEAETSKHAH